MATLVYLTKQAQKDLRKIPRHILIQFDLWIKIIEIEGYKSMQKINGYNDHALKGKRKGQRSSYLSKSWRVIYTLDEIGSLIKIEVLEVNHHEY